MTDSISEGMRHQEEIEMSPGKFWCRDLAKALGVPVDSWKQLLKQVLPVGSYMPPSFYVVWRNTMDPIGTEFVAVCLSMKEAKNKCENAAQEMCDRANDKRYERFMAGEQCGRMRTVEMFEDDYKITEVRSG